MAPMEQSITDAARARARGRRRAWIGGAVVVALVAGAVVVVGQTGWWGCRFGTSSSEDSLAYVPASEAMPADDADLVEVLESVPGVGGLLGSATLDGDVRVVPGADGGFVVSDYPYFSDEDEFYDSSLDTADGEVAWSRGQAGQSAEPIIAGDSVLSLAAVSGGIYRLSVLDSADGSVRGCIDVHRVEDAGIGRAAFGTSADGATVAIATPTDSAATASAFTVDGQERLWDATLPGGVSALTWTGETVVIDRFAARDVYSIGPTVWDGDERSRASVTGIDGATGEEAWAWPSDRTDDAIPEAGSSVPFIGGPDDIVVLSAIRTDDVYGASRLVGLDAASGVERWSVETSHPWVHGFGDTVVTLGQGTLSALDAASGAERWSIEVTGGASGPRPDTAQPWGDDLLLTSGDGISIVDLETGDLTHIPTQNGWMMRATVSDDALAIVVDDQVTSELLVFSRE